MATINETPRLPNLSELAVSRTPQQSQVQQSFQAQRYNQHQKQTAFSSSDTLDDFQTQLSNILLKQGFAQDQAAKLVQAGVTRLPEFSRSLLISQVLLGNKQLFERFAKTLRQIMLREQNNEQGIKVYLDVLDQVLNINSQEMIEEELAQTFFQHSEKKSGNYSGQLGSEADFPLPLKDLAQLMQKSAKLLPRHLSTGQIQQMQSAMDFAEVSAEEFPQRFASDLFAFSELSRRGVTLDQYLRLANELPPLRLVNLFQVLENLGQHPTGALQVFLTAFENGETLLDILEQMEIKYGISVPPAPHQAALRQSRHVTMNTDALLMSQGEDVVVDFLGMDRLDGLVSGEKSGFVLFPQREEFPGHTINLNFLPVGVYYLVAATLNSRKKMMTLWKKVIVQNRNGEQYLGQETGQSPEQKNRNESQEESKPGFVPGFLPQQESAQALRMDFSAPSPVKKGLFLAEIVLPTQSFSAQADQPVLLMTNSGLIVDREEYSRGNFPHHAVMFRFLAGDMQGTDLRKRHEVLHLASSRAFEKLDVAIRDFLTSTKDKLSDFQKKIEEFFAELLTMFPAGQKTFEVARGLILREAQSLAQDAPNQNLYHAESHEHNQREFVSAVYAKGAYAMAAAGHVAGALRGLTYASLVNWDDENQRAVLGEYIENLKNAHFARAKRETIQNYYDMHLNRGAKEKLLASPLYRNQGEEFIQSFNFPLSDIPGKQNRNPNHATYANPYFTEKN